MGSLLRFFLLPTHCLSGWAQGKTPDFPGPQVLSWYRGPTGVVMPSHLHDVWGPGGVNLECTRIGETTGTKVGHPSWPLRSLAGVKLPFLPLTSSLLAPFLPEAAGQP